MFDKARSMMEDYLNAFGVDRFPPIIETEGKGVSFQPDPEGPAILIGRETVVDSVPLAEWLVTTGNTLLYQIGSDIAPLFLGSESEEGERNMRVADDLYYIADLAAIYQCYLQNPVETYCIYDDAIELKDEASLHPIAVALGLSHPKGLVSMGFNTLDHEAVFEEAEFFRPVITQKRPDLSLLVSLMNAWQKQKKVDIKISNKMGILMFDAS